MADERPNPDALLAEIGAAEARQQRGKLKIFFGAAAGVGKTYAMLEEARQKAVAGVKVLVGYAEPHIRPQTEALLLGLDILPYRMVNYRGTELKEFDLDAALTARPQLILVDELAHTNPPGLRHAKRWQDVAELIAAGIDVYTTLNVQHLESVNDVVERATGVKVRETLPDSVFESAEEVQLVDLPPEKLIERLREDKIYAHDRAEAALRNFFTFGNLLALRELALRRTADRINRDIDTFRGTPAPGDLAAVSERVMVCVGPSPSSVNLVRTAARMAAVRKTPWLAVYVQTPHHLRLSDTDRNRVAQTLNLAEQLGGQAVTLSGLNPAREIIAYARSHNVARILVGKPATHGWRRWFRRPMLDDLIRTSGPIQLLLIQESPAPRRPGGELPQPPERRGLAWAVAVVALNTVLGMLLHHGLGLSNINVIMLYLLGVLWISARYSRAAGILTAGLSALAFNFTMVEPYYALRISDTQYLISLGAMLITGLSISALTTQLRHQERLSRLREQRTQALLQLSRALILCPDRARLVRAAVRHVSEFFASPVGILEPVEGALPRLAEGSDPLPLDEKERSVADWVIRHNAAAGASTDTLPSARGVYLPLKGVQSTLGALGMIPGPEARLTDPDQMRTLESFTEQIIVAMERMMLSTEAQRAWERAEVELLRNSLLSAVSHDLRSPLATITESAKRILQAGAAMAPETQRQWLATITAEAEHLERLIGKLLEMTRLESGSVVMRREALDLRELLGAIAARWRPAAGPRELQIAVPDDLPPIPGDPLLLEQLFSNLVENALEHSAVDTPIEIDAAVHGGHVIVRVMDRGRGLPEQDTQRIFEKLYRVHPADHPGGLGLGLAICRAIMQLHHGSIEARNRPGGGAQFDVALPVEPLAIGVAHRHAAEEPAIHPSV